METIDTLACEFGYEIIMVVPYANYLHENGQPVTVITSRGMRVFYHFLPEDRVIERYQHRTWVEPDRIGVPLKTIHFPRLDTARWIMPDYTVFRDTPIHATFDREIVMVSNKYQWEWSHPPVNFLSVETLDRIFTILKDRYTIIYNRPDFRYIPDDLAATWPQETFGDFDLIRERHPEVIDINRLKETEDVDFNTLQLIMGARCAKKISVQGGGSILASLTGGTNLILAKEGAELDNNSFSWYREFSNATVISTTSDEALITLIRRHYV